MSAAFYCASSELFFPGAVALVNSLRLHGHREPIYLLDCGLAPGHRELLAEQVTIVDDGGEAMPHLRKTVVPLAHPAETMVLIDADMIVTSSLAPLIERARAGVAVAVENDMQRFDPSWGPLLGLGASSPRRYVSSGLVALGGELGAELLALWGELCRGLDFERSAFAEPDPGYAFQFIDQDVLNAILGAPRFAEHAVTLPGTVAPVPPFAGVRLADVGSVRAVNRDGSEPLVLHHSARKPWLARLRSNPYSHLLTRLLLADDVPMRLPPAEVPARLRQGATATAARLASDLLMTGPGIARRLRRPPEQIRIRPGTERA